MTSGMLNVHGPQHTARTYLDSLKVERAVIPILPTIYGIDSSISLLYLVGFFDFTKILW